MSVVFQSVAEANAAGNVIEDVSIKELKTWPDDRGFFREVVRYNDEFFAGAESTKADAQRLTPFAQWSHSKMSCNTVKAWHIHHRQTDWWYCALGALHVVLFDLREESPTYQRKMEFILGDPDPDSADAEAIKGNIIYAVVRIPPGVAHGLKVLSKIAHLMYITSEIYDPQDEGRHPFHCDTVPHHWGNEADLIVVEKDRHLFVPPYPRRPIR